jgi:hypothetical protein
LCGQFAAEGIRRDVVDEGLDAADLDHRDQLAVARLELLLPRDVDLAQLESELGAQLFENRAGTLAEVAAGRVVEDDFRYG